MGPFKDIGVEKIGHVGAGRDQAAAAQFFRCRADPGARRRPSKRSTPMPIAARWCWPRRARPSAPAPISAMAARSTATAAARRAAARRRASLSRGQPALPHQEADRRGGARRRRRRRPWAGDGGRLSRDLPRGALLRQLHPARLSSRFRADRHAARGHRAEQGGADVLHEPPRQRRGGFRHGPRRRAGAAGRGARSAALALAAEIAENSPLGLIATRATLRGDIADRVRAATEHELAEQMRLRKTDDFKEGVKAMAERRVPVFTNR